jgi:hypothetical protein
VKRALLSHFHVGDARPRPVHLQEECHETQREHVGVRHLRRADPLQSVERVEPYGLPVVEMVVPRRPPYQMPLEGEASEQDGRSVGHVLATCGGDSASPSRVKNRRLMPRSVKSPWPLKFHTSSWLTSTVRPQSMSMQ